MRGMPNPLALIMGTYSSGSAGVMGNSASMQGGIGVFMQQYIAMTTRMIETSGAVTATNGRPVFEEVNRTHAKFVLEPLLDPAMNPYFIDHYVIPGTMTTGTQPQTWTEYMSGFYTAPTLAQTVTSGASTIILTQRINGGSALPHPLMKFPYIFKIENEWIQVCSGADNVPSGNTTLTVCSGGRGLYGTAAVSHNAWTTVNLDRQIWGYAGVDHNYSNLYVGSVAMFEDLSTSLGSGRKAWERVWVTQWGTDQRTTGAQWMLVPRDRIQSVRVTPGTGSLALRWVAPDGAACKVHVGATEPSSSDDSGDATATVISREQSYSASGLDAGTAYYRISCGAARVTGTATVQ
jgi:hypothetical protein